MTDLVGAEEAANRLRRTSLRDFGPPGTHADDCEGADHAWYKMAVPHTETPVPHLLRYALTLIGLRAHGPGEKMAWSVPFTFRGMPASVSHEKFGVRIYVQTEKSEAEAEAVLKQIAKKLTASMRTVEDVLLGAAPTLLNHGDATVINQYVQLRRAYDYFRERAQGPIFIADERTEHHVDGAARAWSFTSGQLQMKMNAFHDLVAAISAYVSLLEHVLVLALPFRDFDPAHDVLTQWIGARWGDKFRRVFGTSDAAANRFRERLTAVVERWRNPYSHGGFEKGNGATIYLHAPGIGAVPVGLTSVRESPLFSFLPATESDIADVFALFDEMDEWLALTLPYAMRWISAGLEVRFDAKFRHEVRAASASTVSFDEYLEYTSYQIERAMNMDF